MSRETFGTLADHRIPGGSPLLISIDPGQTTGWAVWCLDERLRGLLYGQEESSKVLDQLHWLLRRMGPNAIRRSQLVMEKFIVPARPKGTNDDIVVPCEVIGAVKYLCRRYGLAMKMQLPVERNIISPKLLEEWGWVSREIPLRGRDATSAVKHLGSYLLQKGTVPTLKSVV